MTRAWNIWAFAAATMLAVGCDDDRPTVDAGARDAGLGGSDAGPAREDAGPAEEDAGTGGGDAGPDDGPCPTSLPTADRPCEMDGLICEYGPRRCPSFAECAEGTWQVAVPRCPPLPAEGCPASREDAAGAACAGDEGAVCEYDSLLCRCTSCPDPYPVCRIVDPPVWACEAPNPDPECPPGQPRLGSACAMDGQMCDYGCEAGQRRVCSDGVWTRASGPSCPVSTRRVKRDIDYLGPREVDAIARDVLRTRLATYEYTDPALARGRHLGFIIEDQPHAYSVEPERSQVDLYGYASMLLAALQSQQRRIDVLEARLRAVEERRPGRSSASRPRGREAGAPRSSAR